MYQKNGKRKRILNDEEEYERFLYKIEDFKPPGDCTGKIQFTIDKLFQGLI